MVSDPSGPLGVCEVNISASHIKVFIQKLEEESKFLPYRSVH